jgi:predicted peptidase
MRYRINCFLTTFIFLFALQPLHAQLSKKYAGYEEKYYQSMRYGFFKPAGYDEKKSYPLVVYLHGSRDTVSRELNWYQESIQNANPAFVLTPKCENPDQGWGNTWEAGHSVATAKTLKLVDSLAKKYNIDTNRLYLYGISMGGFGVFSILAKEKGKFAAAYAICGGSKVSAASQLTETPLWIFHGEADDIVPVSLSRDVYKEIVRLGGKYVRYTEYPGVKHNSWENVSQEKSLVPWVLAQRKRPSK